MNSASLESENIVNSVVIFNEIDILIVIQLNFFEMNSVLCECSWDEE